MGVILLIARQMKVFGIKYAARLDGVSGLLSRTFAADDGDTWTASFWEINNDPVPAGNQYYFSDTSGGFAYTAASQIRAFNGATFADSTRKFRGPSAFKHHCISSNAGAVTYYINGVAVVGLSAPAFTVTNSAVAHQIGAYLSGNIADILLAEFRFISDQALLPSDFAEFDLVTGNWKAKKYTGTYGTTNGCYLDFSNAGALGTDVSGMGNHWTVSATGVSQITSTPSNTYSNLNVLDKSSGGTISNGNSTIVTSGANTNIRTSLLIPDTGTHSFSFVQDVAGGGNAFGICNAEEDIAINIATAAGSIYYSSALVDGDVVRFEVNADTLLVDIFKNNVLVSGSNAMAAGMKYLPFIRTSTTATSQTTFYADPADTGETPTAGFKALTTDHLPKQTGSIWDHMIINQRQSDGASSVLVDTSSLFDPTTSGYLVWTKSLDFTGHHVVLDSLRTSGYSLRPNGNNAEINATATVSVGSTGLTYAYPDGDFNYLTYKFMDTVWSLPTHEVNTAGTLSVTWDLNATIGKAVGLYIGDGTTGTFGLPAAITAVYGAPDAMLVKRVDAIDDWYFYHKELGGSAYMLLDSTAAAVTASSVPWGGTAPTASVATVNSAANVSGGTYLVICYWNTPYCKVGAFKGQYAFANLGGDPVWGFWHRSDAAGDPWVMPSFFQGYNEIDKFLVAQASNAEATDTTYGVDADANGMKVWGANTAVGAAGGVYPYVFMVQPNGPIPNVGG